MTRKKEYGNNIKFLCFTRRRPLCHFSSHCRCHKLTVTVTSLHFGIRKNKYKYKMTSQCKHVTLRVISRTWCLSTCLASYSSVPSTDCSVSHVLNFVGISSDQRMSHCSSLDCILKSKWSAVSTSKKCTVHKSSMTRCWWRVHPICAHFPSHYATVSRNLVADF